MRKYIFSEVVYLFHKDMHKLILQDWLIFTLLIGLSDAKFAFTFPVRSDGSYSVNVNNDTWLNSSATAFQLNGKRYSSSDGSLKLLSYAKSGVADALGFGNRYRFQYSADGVNVSTSARTYYHAKDRKSFQLAVYSQEFPDGASKTSVNDMHGVVSEFPSFQIPAKSSLGFLAYGDLFAGYERLTMNRWQADMKQLPGGLYTGPLVLFDTNHNVIIISALNHFTAASYHHDTSRDSVAWGIMGNVETIPTGYTLETIVYASNKGINKAMEEWGALLCRIYGRTTEAVDTDVTINYLGYYTDNGAFYYHLTEPNKTYEQTLFDVYNDSLEKNIPYKYIQYDDWWYPIETTKTTYGAVLEWTALPSVFPHGLQKLYDVMKFPVIAHNRYWSYKTPLAKANNGSWDFVIDNEAGMALPLQQEFWEWLFYEAKKWGLVTYEQDFMCTQMEKIKALNTDISLAEKWLVQMGRAAARYNLKLQYCMTLPREIMQALEIPPVSQARASGDYVSPVQWKIGVTSLFLYAMKIAPFKDNFWTAHVEEGNVWGRKEVNPVREALVAILSTGPVGVSDKIGLTNSSITSRLCRSDGLLLKPGRPATAIDRQIWQSAFGGNSGPTGEVYSSVYHFSISTYYERFMGFYSAVIFASEMITPYNITLKDINYPDFFPTMMYTLDNPNAAPVLFKKLQLDESTCGKNSSCVYYLTWGCPIKNRGMFVFMGELSKYVPLSPQRIANIDYELEETNEGTSKEDVQFTFHLKGAGGEHVSMYYYLDKRVHTVECVMSDYGTATLHFPSAECSSS